MDGDGSMKQYWTEEKIKSAKYDELKKRCEEAEGELAIIKGIGNKSPEMSALQKENNELAKMIDITREEAQVIQLQADNEVRKFTKRIADLEDINKSHQKLNGELRKELTYINKKYVDSLKKLADQKDLVKTYRKAGIL
jgi:phage host-nuclease inhibitor protein Gam